MISSKIFFFVTPSAQCNIAENLVNPQTRLLLCCVRQTPQLCLYLYSLYILLPACSQHHVAHTVVLSWCNLFNNLTSTAANRQRLRHFRLELQCSSSLRLIAMISVPVFHCLKLLKQQCGEEGAEVRQLCGGWALGRWRKLFLKY